MAQIQDSGIGRREFLRRMVASGLALKTVANEAAGFRRAIRAVAFDAFPILDPRPVFALVRDRKKVGELCGSRLPPGLRIESWIPLVELASEIFIQRLCPYLQEQMGAAATPAHLLFFDEPFA